MTTVHSLSTSADPAHIARQFQALSDPTRLSILQSLQGGECCVCDLQSELAAAQSRLSFHLRVLKNAGFVTDRKDGRWSWYQLVPGVFDEVRAALDGLSPSAALQLQVVPLGRSLPLASGDEVQADGCCG